MKSKAKMHQMIIEIQSTNWELFFSVGLKYTGSHWTVHLVVLSTLDCSGGIFKTFWFPHCKCQSYLFAGYKVFFVTGPNFSVELKIQCFKQLLLIITNISLKLYFSPEQGKLLSMCYRSQIRLFCWALLRCTADVKQILK